MTPKEDLINVIGKTSPEEKKRPLLPVGNYLF